MMKATKGSNAYLVGAVHVQVGILATSAVILAGTPYFGQMLPVLAGGAVYFVVIVPAAWSRRPRGGDEDRNDTSAEVR